MATRAGSTHPCATTQRQGIEQIVVHLGPPLAIAGVDEVLAVAGGSPVVDLDADIAPIGEPLGLGVETPGVPGPRAPVHVQHRRESRPRLAHGKGQVPVQLEAVACDSWRRAPSGRAGSPESAGWWWKRKVGRRSTRFQT